MTTHEDDTQPADSEHAEFTPADAEEDEELPDHTEPQPGAAIKAERTEDGGLNVSFSDGSDDLEMSRREFLRVSGVATASAAMAGVNCRYPKEEIVPYVDRPEENRPGQAEYYATVCGDSPSQAGVLVKTRSGRPIKLKGNPDHPVNEGSLSARGEASYRRLYDPDRAESPLSIEGRGETRELDWGQLDKKVVSALEKGGSVRILTRNVNGSGTRALLGDITEQAADAAHYEWEPLTSEAVKKASDQCFGSRHVPRYHFDEAEVIVSLGSDFLGTWLSPTEFTGDWAEHRDPDEAMSRLITFEGSMTVTGSNSDDRYRVRPSNLVYVALALAHEVVLEHEQGAFADDDRVRSALQPFSPKAVAEVVGPDNGVVGEADSMQKVLEARAAELVEHAGSGLVVAGNSSRAPGGISLESAVNLLNAALGNEGETVERARPTLQDPGSFDQLQMLVEEMKADEVDVLIVDGVNPVYSAPPELGFEEAMQNVDLVVDTSDRVDETAARADLLATGSHFLESWGDAQPYPGVHSIQQPAIQPLYETRSFEESLVVWFGESGIVPGFKPHLESPEDPNPEEDKEGSFSNVGEHVPYDAGAWYRYLRAHWRDELFPRANTLSTFDSFWQSILQTGVWEGPGVESGSEPTFQYADALDVLPDELPSGESVDPGDLSSKELHMFATVPMYDGRHANNGHLQELPDRITKHTWGSYVLVSPTTFNEAGLEQGDVLAIEPEGTDEMLEFPVIMQPGMHDDVVAVPLGYGRTHAGVVGNEVGENTFYFSQVSEAGHQVLSGIEAELNETGDAQEVSVVQGAQVLDINERPILPTATLDAYEDDHHAGIGAHEPGRGLWDAHEYDLKWGMSVDLSTCTGCGACVTACQEENNVPVVGRKGVLEGREMHWLRIDRYYLLPSRDQNPELHEMREDLTDDPMYAERPLTAFAREYPEEFDNPPTRMQPMLCQHCENAPCETVCPVAATTHSSDGLNQMTYNRCVGTRYCANNCPYKVRRYNWFNYSGDRRNSMASEVTPELNEHGRLNVSEPLPMSLNPDVTVRSRGVMEKCTFCVQRIRRAKWQKKEENREYFDEDDVKTACEEACPAGAIEFGAIVQKGADEDHQVRKDHESSRSLHALSSLNTKPSVAYLTDVRNTRQRSNRSKGGHGGGHGGGGSHGKGGHEGGGGHGGGSHDEGDHGGGSHGSGDHG